MPLKESHAPDDLPRSELHAEHVAHEHRNRRHTGKADKITADALSVKLAVSNLLRVVALPDSPRIGIHLGNSANMAHRKIVSIFI